MQLKIGKSLDELKQIAVSNINETSYNKITAEYPIWKQLNNNSRAIALLLADTLTQEEQEELIAIKHSYTYIEEVKALSNTLVSELTNITCPVQLRQFEKDAVMQIENFSEIT